MLDVFDLCFVWYAFCLWIGADLCWRTISFALESQERVSRERVHLRFAASARVAPTIMREVVDSSQKTSFEIDARRMFQYRQHKKVQHGVSML